MYTMSVVELAGVYERVAIAYRYSLLHVQDSRGKDCSCSIGHLRLIDSQVVYIVDYFVEIVQCLLCLSCSVQPKRKLSPRQKMNGLPSSSEVDVQRSRVKKLWCSRTDFYLPPFLAIFGFLLPYPTTIRESVVTFAPKKVHGMSQEKKVF